MQITLEKWHLKLTSGNQTCICEHVLTQGKAYELRQKHDEESWIAVIFFLLLLSITQFEHSLEGALDYYYKI